MATPIRARTRTPRKPVGQTVLDARSQKAWKAVRQFTSMIPTFTAFARMITQDNGVVVRLGDQGAQTDGRVIWIAPPISLGEDRVHDRQYCQKRGDNLRQLCKACDAREVTLFYLYHEIAHIAEKSTAKPRQQLVNEMSELIDVWHPEGACSHGVALKYLLGHRAREDYMNLAEVHNDYLPTIFNALEDARVNARMFKARPGLKVLFEAGLHRVFETGIELPSTGEIQMWHENPLNSQVIIGLFLIASGHHIEEHYFSEVAQGFLRDEQLVDISKRAVLAQSAHQIMHLSIEAFRRLTELGLCHVRKCVPAPPAPPSPPQEEADDEEQDDDQQDDQQTQDEDSESDGNTGSPGESDSSPPPGDDSGDSESSDDGDPSSSDDASDGAESAGEGAGRPKDQQDPGDASPPEAGDTGDTERSPGDGEDDEDFSYEDLVETAKQKLSSHQKDQDPDDKAAPEPEPQDGSPGVRDGGDPEDNPVVEDEPDPEAEGDDQQRQPSSENDVVEEDAATDGTDEDAQDSDDREDDDDSDDGDDDDDWADYGDEDRSSSGGPEGDSDSEDDSEGDEDLDDEEADRADESVWDDPASPENAGSAEQVAESLKTFGGHAEGETVDHTHFGVEHEHEHERVHGHEHGHDVNHEADLRAVAQAIKQSGVFDTRSQVLAGLEVLQYPQPTLRWKASSWQKLEEYAIRPEIIEPAIMKARLVFEENRRGKHQHNLKAGRVNPAVLGKRAPVGDPRLMSKKTRPGKRSYFVVIGVDVSGSTDTNQRNPRIKRAVFAQAELLHRAGVPFAIYGMTGNRDLDKPYEPSWTDDGCSVWMMEVKAPSEPWNTETQLRLAALRPVAYNFDGHNLEFLRKLCDQQTATDRIILYYTDGEMPASNEVEETAILQTELGECRRRQYEVLGVGINTDSPRQYGLDTVQVDGDEDIIKVVNQLESRLAKR